MIACQQTTRRSDSRLIRAGLGLAGVLALGAGCKAPKILCTTAHAGAGNVPFAVKYTKLTGDGECAMLKGGLVGIESYVNGGPEQAPSFAKPPVAIRLAEVGDLITTYTEEPPPPPDGGVAADAGPVAAYAPPGAKMLSSVGVFMDERPDDSGFCKVGPMTPVSLDLPAHLSNPPLKVTYEWSDVRFYVSAALIGTQFTANLKYTRNNCVATYSVMGLYPGVHCEGTKMGADGKPTGSGLPDPVACDPCADPANGRPAGSGISPDIETVCDPDPDVLFCLPKAAPPSLSAKPKVCAASSAPPPTPSTDTAAPMSNDTAASPPDVSGGDDTAAATGDTAAAGDTAASGDGNGGG